MKYDNQLQSILVSIDLPKFQATKLTTASYLCPYEVELIECILSKELLGLLANWESFRCNAQAVLQQFSFLSLRIKMKMILRPAILPKIADVLTISSAKALEIHSK